MSVIYAYHPPTVLITGGYGFIGKAVIKLLLEESDCRVVNVDSLTPESAFVPFGELSPKGRYVFREGDIADRDLVEAVFNKFKPDVIINLAAETHVDRSITDPDTFLRSNVHGTFCLLEVARKFSRLKPNIRFHHVSTDEVFGSLQPDAGPVDEDARYDPSSPYSATKACADHLVRAWGKTYGLDIVISHSSNNYGPFQNPEKLIPKVISCAQEGKAIPIFGDGTQIREWLYVDDHARGIAAVVDRGESGNSYNIGSGELWTNIDLVRQICSRLEVLAPSCRFSGGYERLITRVADRPAHDQKYALDATKIRRELRWKPRHALRTALTTTIRWYVDQTHERRIRRVRSDAFAGLQPQ